MAFAFAGQWGPEPVVDRFGNAVYSATFRVLTTAGAEATVYTDRTKATTVAQPLDVDGEGNATFYAVPGRYTVELTAGGSVTSFPVGVVPDAEDVEPAPDVDSRFAATAWRTGRLVFDVTDAAYGAVGDGVADDAAAVQAAIDAAEAAGGGIVFFPGGTYRVASVLTVEAEGVWLVGASREDCTVNFDLTTLLDGIDWNNTTGGSYVNGGGIRDLTLKAVTDRSTVRDVVNVEDPGDWVMERVNVRGGGRYGVNLDVAINVSLVDCIVQHNNNAGLYVDAATSTSTTVRARGCYFTQTKNGAGADVNTLGMHFEACVFESNGELTPSAGYGALVRGGYASFDGCYWENNAQADINAGTVSTTHLTITGFHSNTGSYTVAGSTHVLLGAFIRSAGLLGGRYDTRKSVGIDPAAEQVYGMGLRWAIGANQPYMTDASDIMAKSGVYIVGLDAGTGEIYAFGRVDGDLRRLHIRESIRLPDGTASLPAWRFTSDADTGAYWIGSDRFALVTGAFARLDINNTRVRALQDLRVDGKLQWGADAGVFDFAGTGTPEGVVTAPVGSTFRRSDGGAGTCFYVKESGTGPTGWVAK